MSVRMGMLLYMHDLVYLHAHALMYMSAHALMYKSLVEMSAAYAPRHEASAKLHKLNQSTQHMHALHTGTTKRMPLKHVYLN